MACKRSMWMDKHSAFVDHTDTANAPCKDFYHIFVTENQIIFRYWKIVPPTRADSGAPPVEYTSSYDDFLHDDRCHSEIQRLAGDGTLQYLINIAQGQLDYLPRLSDDILKKIILKLDLEDIVRLGSTNRKFRELCSDNAVWEKIFHREQETPVSSEMELLAEREGWKRLFYTNKLQLQMQLRRQKRQTEDQAFMTEQEQQEEDDWNKQMQTQ